MFKFLEHNNVDIEREKKTVPSTLSPAVWTNFLDWFKFLFVLDGLVLLCPLKMVLNSLASWGCFGRCILSVVVWFITFEVHGTLV
ncbi:hypothetical protein Peur_048345 [Populus x canadensis]